jgi:hypothetical protein
VTNNQARVQDVKLTAGEPTIRILGFSKPTPDQGTVTFDRTGVIIRQGQSNYFTGVISKGLRADTVLGITGSGLTVGAGIFLENKFGVGLHAMLVPISVSSNAPPGLRSYVVTGPGGIAYANGYLEVARAVPDDNFDGLDDLFQRAHWSPWTIAAAAPAADPDGDRFSNSYEYRTGSNPLDANSWLVRLNPAGLGRFGTTLTWPAALGRRYQLSTRADFAPGTSWQAVGGPITATNENVTALDAIGSAAKFYRLELLP